jgi:hypothetical protein
MYASYICADLCFVLTRPNRRNLAEADARGGNIEWQPYRGTKSGRLYGGCGAKRSGWERTARAHWRKGRGNEH